MARFSKPLIMALGLAFILGGGGLLPRLRDMREQYRLTAGTPLENAPPELVFTTTALAGMRGIVVDFLWMRAIRMEREGKYFELVQLYDWIGKLEPRFAWVWRLAAWNMAYNVSKCMPRAEDRWRWILSAIELLRDRGIRLNPREPQLYRELAFIYFHRIGQRFDLFHVYFQAQFADMMQRVLGPEQDIRALAAAPQSRAALLEDEAVRKLVEMIAAAGLDPFSDPVGFANGESPEASAVRARVTDERGRASLARLDAYLRASYLRNQMRLEPRRMLALMEGPEPEGYGPFDWRLPYPHAIYWTRQGQMEGGLAASEANDDRMIYDCMKLMLQRGRLYYRPASPAGPAVYYTDYDWVYADKLDEIYMQAIRKYDPAGMAKGMKNTHRDFLKEAVVQLYAAGRPEKAAEYLAKLRRLYPEKDLNRPLEDFVLFQMHLDMQKWNAYNAQGLIASLMRRSFLSYANHDPEGGEGFLRLARLIWDKHMQFYAEHNVDVELPPFGVIRQRVYMDCIKTLPPDVVRELKSVFEPPAAPQ